MQSLVQVCIFDTRKRNKSKLFVSPPHCGVARHRPREVTLKLLDCRGGDIYFLPTAMRVALLRGVSTDMVPAPPLSPAHCQYRGGYCRTHCGLLSSPVRWGRGRISDLTTDFPQAIAKWSILRQTKVVAEVLRSSIAWLLACVL